MRRPDDFVFREDPAEGNAGLAPPLQPLQKNHSILEQETNQSQDPLPPEEDTAKVLHAPTADPPPASPKIKIILGEV